MARVESGLGAAASSASDRVTGIVIGYVLSVITSVAIMLIILNTGW